ncbi:helix-turn-helix domain-containing protein [Buchananella hordeovulneris]|uniref:helix-turn-helix domain-containing protein n=1 Tax=Buchananella hordeovulneris TaxID=52770 RepID=UPI001FEDEA75|nr:helix-turn-helix domain-containing protein [Buchananella hordeovulneris]
MLTFEDRVEIGAGLQAGLGVREIARRIGRDLSVVCREIKRNGIEAGGYRIVAANTRARKRRCRLKARKVAANPVLEARARQDLARSCSPRQIAGRLRAEAGDRTLQAPPGSRDVQGLTLSHDAIYQHLYALPKGELAKHGIMLRSKRSSRKPRQNGHKTGARIVGMVSIDDRSQGVDDRLYHLGPGQ